MNRAEIILAIEPEVSKVNPGKTMTEIRGALNTLSTDELLSLYERRAQLAEDLETQALKQMPNVKPTAS